MTLLVVGATGTLGRQVVRRALDEGHKVRCLVRSYSRAGFLKEWGAELVGGNICKPKTLTAALEGVTAVIDVATARPTDSIKKVDWEGKVALIQAVKAAGIERYIFFSFLNAEKYPEVPLLQIKHCTELFLAESGLKYTILRPCGFLQGLIGQYAVPILDNQAVWVPGGQGCAIAYMDTIDVAKFAIKALQLPETEGKTFPLVGTKAWESKEIVSLCERLSGEEAKVTKTNINLLRLSRQVARWFQWTWNISDRLAFEEVFASGQALTAPMESVYETFGIDRQEMTTLEAYLQEYYSRIIKKLKEIEYEQAKMKKPMKKKNNPFFF